MQENFDADFASVSQWARMYRSCGLQVVPAKSPAEVKRNESFKRPAIAWREHEKHLIGDELFEQWYGAGGEFANRQNMGVITGSCSGNLLVIDLDTHKHPEADIWWGGIHADHHGGVFLETATQTTGGGGKQYFFRAPAGVRLPTTKTPIGVDFRGEGGFAMLPPSKHDSGGYYHWDDGFEPNEVGIELAPEWLLEEVITLAAKYGAGGEGSSGAKEKTPTPERATDAFGNIVDGREDYMHRMIFAAVVNSYRDCPILPDPGEQQRLMRECFKLYELRVKSRLREPGTPNHILLEREGRGLTVFTQKWRETVAQWDNKIARAAGEPPPKRGDATAAGAPEAGPGGGAVSSDPDEDGFSGGRIEVADPEADVYELLSIRDIMNMPDPVYLVEDLIMERALGFLFAAPGLGKTFIAKGIALSIATGRPDWWGRKISRKAPVLYISSEGVNDMKFRIEAWSLRHKTPVTEGDINFHLLKDSVNFMDAECVMKLLRTMRAEYGDAPPAMVIVDTVSRTLPGADENLQKDMTLYIKTCQAIQEAFGCAVMGVHHTARAGANMRGSTVFDGAADFLMSIDVDEETGDRFLVARKIKSARDGWREAFTLTEVAVGIGKSSLVAERVTDRPQPAGEGFGGRQEMGGEIVDGKKWPHMDVCKAVLRDLQRAWDEGRPWSSNKQTREDGRYAPWLMKDRFGIEPALAENMIRRWLSNDVISSELRDSKTKMKGLRVMNGLPT